MTAPDPGLTDLIAAHQAGDRWTDFQYPSIFSDKPFVATAVTKMVNCSCGESMPAESHPVHVALVVEQRTNGRIAELEAELEKQKRGGRTIGKAIDRTLKWVIEASNSEDLIGDDGDGDWEIVWDRLFQLRPDLDAANARAERAEATVARVITALEAAEKSVPDDWGVTYIYTSQLRAALEGKS